jgi:hypothetical protein
MPQIETAFSQMANMTHFAKIDLTNAYNQIELDDESKEITTINTPIGLLRWTRLPFGIKTASAQFQAAIEKTLGEKVQNIIIFQDDILIGGKNEKQLMEKVAAILKLLQYSGMTINDSQSIFKTQ